jgi:hypothetical protein
MRANERDFVDDLACRVISSEKHRVIALRRELADDFTEVHPARHALA